MKVVFSLELLYKIRAVLIEFLKLPYNLLALGNWEIAFSILNFLAFSSSSLAEALIPRVKSLTSVRNSEASLKRSYYLTRSVQFYKSLQSKLRSIYIFWGKKFEPEGVRIKMIQVRESKKFSAFELEVLFGNLVFERLLDPQQGLKSNVSKLGSEFFCWCVWFEGKRQQL